MNSKYLIAFAILVSIIAAILGSKYLSKESYDDCILSHVENGMDKSAILAIEKSCRSKTEAKDNQKIGYKLTPFTDYELRTIDGRAAPSYGNRFEGVIYNGSNIGHSIAEIDFRIITVDNGKPNVRTYRQALFVQPQETSNFSFEIVPGDKGTEIEWSIIGAKGFIAVQLASESNNFIDLNKLNFEKLGGYAAQSFLPILLFYSLFFLSLSKIMKIKNHSNALAALGFVLAISITAIIRAILNHPENEEKDLALILPIATSLLSSISVLMILKLFLVRRTIHQ